MAMVPKLWLLRKMVLLEGSNVTPAVFGPPVELGKTKLGTIP
jgi:hypothetical protein